MNLYGYLRFKIIVLLYLFLYVSNTSFAQENYFLIWDKNASSTANAENLLTIHKILYDFENQKIKATYWQEDNFKGKALGIGYRLSKTLLLDIQIDFLTHLFQHEVFGHGYRYREFELKDNSYSLSLLLPYKKLGGFARRGSADYNRQFGSHEYITMNTGGMNASAVLAKTLKDKWLLRGKMNYRESLLYLSTFHDYTSYVWLTKIFNKYNGGNDIRNYLAGMNEVYGFTTEESYQLTLNNLAAQSSINLINTYHFFAAYTYLKTYLLDAEENFTFPIFHLGETKWLPSIRFGLTPFGGEFMLENHFVKNQNLLEISLRHGDNQLDNFWGAGFKMKREINDLLTLQSRIDIWNQPAMILGGVERFETKAGFGGRISGEIDYQFGKDIPIGLYAQLGYKTTGFIEGENLNKGLVLRLGLSFRNGFKS